MISASEKAEYQRIASLSSWDVAKHYGCSFNGDYNPLEHGGYFYDTRDWEAHGYASAVEFWYDNENECLVVQRGTIHRPSTPDKMESAWRCIGIGADDEVRDNVHAQIDAARSYMGIEPDGTHYPDLMNFKLEDWSEWRIWRSVSGWLKQLGLLSVAPYTVRD